MFDIGGPLTETMRAIALQEGHTVTVDSRGFVFNADMVASSNSWTSGRDRAICGDGW